MKLNICQSIVMSRRTAGSSRLLGRHVCGFCFLSGFDCSVVCLRQTCSVFDGKNAKDWWVKGFRRHRKRSRRKQIDRSGRRQLAAPGPSSIFALGSLAVLSVGGEVSSCRTSGHGGHGASCTTVRPRFTLLCDPSHSSFLIRCARLLARFQSSNCSIYWRLHSIFACKHAHLRLAALVAAVGPAVRSDRHCR